MLKSGFTLTFSPSELNTKGRPALQGRIWVGMLSCEMLPTGACGEILASCLPLEERKPVYECFSKRPAQPLELAY